MNIYKIGRHKTFLFVALAMIIAIISLIVSHFLVSKLAEEERNKMHIWALATEAMMTDDIDAELVLSVLKSNTTIPLILLDKKTNRIE